MLLNLRSGQIDADLPEAIGFSLDIAAHVTSVTGQEIGVWQALYGSPLGTVSWSAQVESFADLAAFNQKLAEDATYLEKASAGRNLFIAGSFQDQITRVIHAAGTPNTPAYSAGINAIAVDQAAAMQFGVEIADLVSAATGNPIMFCVDGYSTMGAMTWIQTMSDAAAIDAAQAAMTADAAIQAKMAESSGLFLPGHSTGFLAQRLN